MAETGISQAELARKCDVAPSRVSAWATGKSKPPGAAIAYLRLLAAVRRGCAIMSAE